MSKLFHVIAVPDKEDAWPPFPVRVSFNKSVEECLDSGGDLFEDNVTGEKFTREQLRQMQESPNMDTTNV